MLDCALEYMDSILFNEKIYKIWDGLIENGGECSEDDSLSKMVNLQYNKDSKQEEVEQAQQDGNSYYYNFPFGGSWFPY